MPVNLEGFEGRIAIVLGDEMLEPAAIFVEQQVAEVGGWALDNHVFVNVALFVPGAAGFEKPEVPRGKIVRSDESRGP